MVKHHYDIDRVHLPRKQWGVYTHRVTRRDHPLLRDVNTRFEAPHSRHNDIPRERFEAAGCKVLAESDIAGVHLAVSEDLFRIVFFQGHPEYDIISLEVPLAGLDIGAAEGLDIENTTETFHVKFDYWLLPFLNVFTIIGNVDGETDVNTDLIPGLSVEYEGMLYGGGVEMAEEMYGRDNIVFHMCGMIPPETSGWFREEITSLDQLQGLKMRFFGLGALVMQKLGVSTQLLAGADIYPALEKGVIDATEFSMPRIDARLGFHKIAKFNYFPGWHQPATMFELLINGEATFRSMFEAIASARHYLLVLFFIIRGDRLGNRHSDRSARYCQTAGPEIGQDYCDRL